MLHLEQLKKEYETLQLMSVNLNYHRDHRWLNITTDELFKIIVKQDFIPVMKRRLRAAKLKRILK